MKSENCLWNLTLFNLQDKQCSTSLKEEKIFTFPGFGNLLIDSIKFRDLPLVEATILIAAAFYIFANLLTDILSIIFNPRLRKQ